MLEQLVVRNLVLVRSATLDLHPGMNVLTGETGAGKTIVAQAVSLLVGGRADAGLVGSAGAEAYVEATFGDQLELPESLAELAPDDAGGELVLARRVTTVGRSRALAWGRSCTRDQLEAAGGALLEMVSQHEARRLSRPAVQLDLLDASADAGAARTAMTDAWRALAAARRALERARGTAGEAEQRRAEQQALVDAVAEVAPSEHEEDALGAERARLRNLDALVAAAAGALERLDPEDGAGALLLAGEAAHVLERVAEHDAELATLVGAIERAVADLGETAHELRAYLASLDGEPGRLLAVEERLEALAELRRRFGAEHAADLLERALTAARELGSSEDSEAQLTRLEAERSACEEAAFAAADRLRRLRRAAGPSFAKAVEGHLGELGMEGARFEVVCSEAALGPRGNDSVEFLLAANPGSPGGPVGQVASGGELSRIALSVRLAAHDRGASEILVFDEIDAGIGGRTARVLAEKLRVLAASTQVVCITHLPQIAAVAERHFLVSKRIGEATETEIVQLADEDVADELVRMLGADDGDLDARALAESLRAR